MVLFPPVFLKARIHQQVRYLYLFRCHFNYAVYLVYYSLLFFLFTLASRDMSDEGSIYARETRENSMREKVTRKFYQTQILW